MRMTILSNAPWANSGYGNQLKLIAPRFVKLGHDVSIDAYYGHQGAPMDWNGCHLYGVAQDPYGMDAVAAYATDFNSDFILTNMDIWVIQSNLFFDKKWVAWIPIDHDPIPPLVEENAAKAFHRIVWTHFGEAQMDDAKLDYDYVPYGVDTQMFYPGNKEQARITAQMPPDKFIVGMVAMNKGFPSRKAFFENITAFKIFHDKHPDTFLYLHTVDGQKKNNNQTVDLKYFCQRIGLKDEDYQFADQFSMLIGFPEHAMNTIYNCMDVHLLVSAGEGFGLPQVEAQAAGVPVICGDWTSMPELLFAGWKVDRNEAMPQYTLQNSYQYSPFPHAIADRLEAAYAARGDKMLSAKARKGALEYDIDKIVEKYWVPTLANIEKKIKETPNKNLSENLDVLRKPA